MALVKQGFTREELYFMPISEYQDYIKILNDENERQEAEMRKIENEAKSSSSQIKTAGNTFRM